MAITPYTKDILKKINYDQIIGLPPLLYGEDDDLLEKRKNLILNSMGVLEIIPGYPGQYSSSKDSGGLRLYNLDIEKGLEKYNELLKNCLKTSPQTIDRLHVAFLNENAFSESWSNDFGESILEESLNFGLPTVKEMRLWYGKNNLSEALKELSISTEGNVQYEKEGGLGQKLFQMFEKFGKLGINFLAEGIRAGENWAKSFLGPEMGGALIQGLYGSNIDFPLIWRGSSFSPSYSITVRLFNPFNIGAFDENGFSQEEQEKYIIEPLAKLLILVVPIADSNSTFFSPLICRVNCPGLFTIRMGYVSSIDVIKGGDVNDVSFFQKPGTIDVKITFSDLYTSMVQTMEGEDNLYDKNRPTLKNYIDNLRGYTRPPSIYFDEYNSYDKDTSVVTDESGFFYVYNEETGEYEKPRTPNIDPKDIPIKTISQESKTEDQINYEIQSDEWWDESAFFEQMPTALDKKEDIEAYVIKLNTLITNLQSKGDLTAAETLVLETAQKEVQVYNERLAYVSAKIDSGSEVVNLYNTDNPLINETKPTPQRSSVMDKIQSITNEINIIQNNIVILENTIKLQEQGMEVIRSSVGNKTIEENKEELNKLKEKLKINNELIINLKDKMKEASLNSIQTEVNISSEDDFLIY